MEKICIARRRSPSRETQQIQRGIPDASYQADQKEEVVSVLLSPEQCRMIHPNQRFMNLEPWPKSDENKTQQLENEKIVFNFHFKKVDSVRMLKGEQVCLMLQIGKGALKGLVKKGKLKSYRIGKTRRFMLNDIMDYILKCEEEQNTTKADCRKDNLNEGVLNAGLEGKKSAIPGRDNVSEFNSGGFNAGINLIQLCD